MEVIKHGNTYKEVECQNCVALLSYCKKDIKEDSRYDDGYFGEIYFAEEQYVICPECDEKVTLKLWINGKEQAI